MHLILGFVFVICLYIHKHQRNCLLHIIFIVFRLLLSAFSFITLRVTWRVGQLAFSFFAALLLDCTSCVRDLHNYIVFGKRNIANTYHIHVQMLSRVVCFFTTVHKQDIRKEGCRSIENHQLLNHGVYITST